MVGIKTTAALGAWDSRDFTGGQVTGTLTDPNITGLSIFSENPEAEIERGVTRRSPSPETSRPDKVGPPAEHTEAPGGEEAGEPDAQAVV